VVAAKGCYNDLKRRVLWAFVRSGSWLRPHALSTQVRTGPLDNVWSYLARLWGWGLLRRRRGVTGRLEYRITDRGRERLAWLESRTAGRKGRQAE